MTSDIFSSLFRYFNAWLLIAFAVAAALLTEKIYLAGASALAKKRGGEGMAVRSFSSYFRTATALPQCARIKTALYCPAAAFAALLTVCASLPICTYIPIIDNGADVVQLVQFMLLSEVFVLLSLYALGTGEALEVARAEMRNMIRLLMPFMAVCASVAAYLIKNGLDSDPFSFNSYSLYGQMRSMSWWGLAGVAIFLLAVLSQIPQRGVSSGTLLLEEEALREYGGAPRGILQIWSVVRSFVVIAEMTYIIFPSDVIGVMRDSASIAWHGQALNFILFWIAAAVVRLFAVPLCRRAMDMIERPLPELARGGVVYLLTVLAVLLLWYEGILLSLEAAAF